MEKPKIKSAKTEIPEADKENREKEYNFSKLLRKMILKAES